MAVQYTGYTDKTPERYLLDAGAVYKNFDFDTMVGTLLGATSGGNQFQLTQEKREIEIDGLKGRGKGNTVIVSEEPILTVNLKELTAENLKLAIAGAEIDAATNLDYDIITSKGKIELTDYLDNITYIGKLSGSNKPVIIMIDNALSMEGIDMTMEDDGEAIVPIQFMGHYDANNIELGTAPFKIYWPKEAV
ncbi:hypothetical protein [Bacillus solitudinis]|uniref:hypothetical protein n=1 Tax=Bacillus solitudinis TaxID=2014074 RepID=UPI000C23DB7F|nr:hypothetical protein [Bacillus solitudinis]